ncbi:MAG: hypothetical protein PVG79_14490, partial [Gemmatimonadales bacterium]
MTRQLGAFAAAGTLALAACAEQPPAGDVLSTSDSAGVTIVEYAALPASAAELPIPAQPSLQLGVVEGDPAEEFEFVTGATRLSDGTVVIADAGASQLRAFGPDGALRWTAGREGEGPGEYRNIDWVRPHGDSLAVYDRSLGRLTVLTLGGDLIHTVNLRPAPGGLRPHVLAVRPDGSMIVRAQQMITPNIAPGVHQPVGFVALYSASGELTDSVVSLGGREWALTIVDGRRLLASHIFGREGLAAASPQAIHIADSGRFEVQSFAADGALRRVLRVTQPATPVTQADIDAYREFVFGRESDESRHPRIRRELEAAPFPETHPQVRRLYTDRADRLWLEEYRRPWETQSRFDVFDADGIFVGRALLPDAERLLEPGPDYVLTRHVDELGVHYVRLY